MNIIALAIRRPVTMAMITVALLMFGAVSLSRLSSNLLPELSYPSLTIRTEYVGAAPAEIETLISKPIEEAVGIIKNVREVRSISTTGRSDVTLEFNWGTDMNFAALDVREKIDALMLPLEANKPMVLRFDPSSEPVMRLGLNLVDPESGEARTSLTEANLKSLRTLAEYQVQRKLETVAQVAAVKLSGGLEDEIHVYVDQVLLAQLNISIATVVQRLREENVNLSGGRIDEGTLAYLVRTLNRFEKIDEIRNVIVERRNDQPIYLKDVAEVEASFKERQAIIRINGQEAVEVAIYKEGDSNTVEVAQAVKQRLQSLEKEVKGKLIIKTLYDQSIFIKQATDNVMLAAIIGGLLAMLVLYAFLKDAWATLVISASIPVSVIAGFNLMYATDITLNIMSLGGIALAIGLLVDNAIVVLENISRLREQGKSSLEAALEGAAEVGPAVLASTLTTVAVFFPMVFVQGIAGQLFSDQALVVTFTLSISLLVSLTLIPVLAARGDKQDPADTHSQMPDQSNDSSVLPGWKRFLKRSIWIGLSRLFVVLSRVIGWALFWLLKPMVWMVQAAYSAIVSAYKPALIWSLANRSTVLSIAFATFFASLTLLPRIGVELIPALTQGEFALEVQMPAGTPIEKTDQVVGNIVAAIDELEGIATIYSASGTGNRLDANPETGGENNGIINIVMANGASETDVQARIRANMPAIPAMEVAFTRPVLFSLKTPLEVEIAGYDMDKLKAVSEQMINLMQQSGNFTEIESTINEGHPEVQIRFDHLKVSSLGMNAADIASRIVTKVRGNVATRYKLDDREIDVLVRAQERDRDSVQEIKQLIVNPGSERPITLGAVAEISLKNGPSEIRRVNQQRVAIIRADISGGDLGAAATQLQAFTRSIDIPQGISVRVAGQSEEMEVSFRSLQLALLLAVFVVYLVMASQFESLIHPFVILFTIPLAGIGAIVSLYLTGSVISVVVFIGLIVLAGIVVNNAIVLIDLINRLRDQNMERTEAIVTACTTRLRPIMMTTLTTTLGLLPLAIGIGEGSEIRAPMAITVIGGLLVSTLLTLLVIPVVYTLFDPLTKKYRASATSSAEPMNSGA